jgi:hypothetical protein
MFYFLLESDLCGSVCRGNKEYIHLCSVYTRVTAEAVFCFVEVSGTNGNQLLRNKST